MTKDKEQWGNIELPGLSDEKLLNTNWNYVEGIRQRGQSADYRKKMSENSLKGWNDPLVKQEASIERRERWQDADYRQRVLKTREEIIKTDEYKNKLKEGHKRSLQDPSLREKFSKASKSAWQRPGAKEKVRTTLKEKWQDPDFKEKMSKRQPRSGIHIHTPWGEFTSRQAALEKMKELGIKNRGNTLDLGLKNDPKNFWKIQK
jgi:hypothetical protein